MSTMNNSQAKSLAPMEGTNSLLNRALKKSTQFLVEYFTEHDLSKVADLPATLRYAEKVIGMFQLDKYDYPEDIMEHLNFLFAACEEMETFMRNPLLLKVSTWSHTPIGELASKEAEIRKALDDRMDALGLDPNTIQFSNDSIIWSLVSIVNELGIAKAERRAEDKDCETPIWYDEPDWDAAYEEEESIIKEHLAEITPSDEWIAEQDAITEMEVMGKTAVEGIALMEAAYNNL